MPEINLLNSTHTECYYAAIIVAAVTLIVTVVLNLLAAIGPVGAYFIIPNREESDNFTDEVTPDAWAFVVLWSIIYVWQLTWMGYAISTLFRTPQHYYNLFPEIMPIWLYLLYILNLSLNIGWLFLEDANELAGCFAFRALMACTLYICLVLSQRALTRSELKLNDEDSKELWLVRVLVQNGLAMYAAWVTITTPLSFISFLQYYPKISVSLSVEDISTIPLVIISVEMIIYSIIENFVFFSQLSSTMTPWFVVIVTVIGILTRYWNPSKRIPLYALALLLGAVVFLIVKVVLIVVRFRYQKKMQHIELTEGNSSCY